MSCGIRKVYFLKVEWCKIVAIHSQVGVSSGHSKGMTPLRWLRVKKSPCTQTLVPLLSQDFGLSQECMWHNFSLVSN